VIPIKAASSHCPAPENRTILRKVYRRA
jgi:hypothetical protein